MLSNISIGIIIFAGLGCGLCVVRYNYEKEHLALPQAPLKRQIRGGYPVRQQRGPTRRLPDNEVTGTLRPAARKVPSQRLPQVREERIFSSLQRSYSVDIPDWQRYAVFSSGFLYAFLIIMMFINSQVR